MLVFVMNTGELAQGGFDLAERRNEAVKEEPNKSADQSIDTFINSMTNDCKTCTNIENMLFALQICMHQYIDNGCLMYVKLKKIG